MSVNSLRKFIDDAAIELSTGRDMGETPSRGKGVDGVHPAADQASLDLWDNPGEGGAGELGAGVRLRAGSEAAALHRPEGGLLQESFFLVPSLSSFSAPPFLFSLMISLISLFLLFSSFPCLSPQFCSSSSIP